MNMSQIPENVHQVLIQLLPAYIINDIKCYVFYDNHPRDEKNIDIIIYTKTGEVREYFQRDLVSNVNLENMGVHTEIKIMRNGQCDLFYLVAGGGELTILSRKDELLIHQKLTEVSSYKITDTACSGKAVLSVVLRHSEIPIVTDDSFKNFKPVEFTSSINSVTNISILTHLKRKLTEAKYSVKCNEKSLTDFLNIRQLVSYSVYKKIHPNLDDSVFKDDLSKMGSALKIFTQKPWIKACNRQIVIVHDVCNGNDEPLEEVQILLHGTTGQSVEYTTKVYEKTDTLPFWKESQSQMLLPNVDSAIVSIVKLSELKDNIISKVEFDGMITYKKKGNECLLPTDTVTLSSLDTMGEQFDVMSNDHEDPKTMVAVLATTEKTELVLRHIKRPGEQNITIDLFCTYLNMERVPSSNNIVIYRKSPYHILNGVMIVLNTANVETNQLALSVYSRRPSQVLALIHHIHDAVPFRILTTTSTFKITSKNDTFSSYNESTGSVSERDVNYMDYATSMLNRTRLVLEYLDNSMIQMSESKNAAVRNKVGSEIDLFALGEDSHIEFKKKMWDEAAKGVATLEDRVSMPLYDEMFVD